MHADTDHDQDLTAYALGELPPAAAAAMERRLVTDAAGRVEVERIRVEATALRVAFAAEVGAGLGSARLAALAASASTASVVTSPDASTGRTPRAASMLRMRPTRSMLMLAGGASLAAAALTCALIIPDGIRHSHGTGNGGEVPVTMVHHQLPPIGSRLPLAKKEEMPVSVTVDLDETVEPIAILDLPLQERGIESQAGLECDVKGPQVAFMAVGSGSPLSGKMAKSRLQVGRVGVNASEEMDDSATVESYDGVGDNPFHASVHDPLSTFSIDVDTASYANVRRYLAGGHLPPKGAVRIEELVNYFPYHDAPPRDDKPFAVDYEVGPCPWEPSHQLARVSLRGKDIDLSHRPAANLVFLLDVSGSMNEPNRLPWVQASLHMLVDQLRADDHVAIVVYGGESGLVLPSTPASNRARILAAIDSLHPGGSTNGASGIQLAYDTAHAAFVKDGINRIVLCTDGDFNVGVSDRDGLTRLLVDEAKGGVFLSVLGFGKGNLKDETMEAMADHGNGNYAYIDTLGEARKVLVEQMSGTLITIAKDVKIQVEFNPARVGAYRLIGYENRLLAARDFNDDRKDAGEIGAGHTVTALYELVPAGAPLPEAGVDPLKYQTTATPSSVGAAGYELMTVKLRSKRPDADASTLMEVPVQGAVADVDATSEDFRFAAAVAAFGMLLRDSPHRGHASYAQVEALAQSGIGRDEHGYRCEFVGLVRQAAALAAAGR